MFCLIIQNLSAQLCVLFCHSLSFIEFTCWEFSSWLSGRMPDSKEVFLPLPFLPSYSNALVYSARGCQLHEFKQQRVQEKTISAQLTAFCGFARWLLEHVVHVLANTGTCGSVRRPATEHQHFRILAKKHAMHFLLFDNERKSSFLATLTAICNHLV